MIGKSLGIVVQVADLEDEGFGSEFLRVRVIVDITKPLTRCSKLWADGKVGWESNISNYQIFVIGVDVYLMGRGNVQCGFKVRGN